MRLNVWATLGITQLNMHKVQDPGRSEKLMSIAKISAYEVPEFSGNNRADWELVPRRAALLLHDLQEYFLKPFEGPGPLDVVVPNVQRLLDWAHANGVLVIYSAQGPKQNPVRRGLLTDFWGKGVPDEEVAQVATTFEVLPQDVVMTKWRYSAFARTDLENLLRFRGIDQLIITGVYAHLGCTLTAADAFSRDIKPFFVRDAVADFSLEEHESALKFVSGRCGVVCDTADLLVRETQSV